MKKFLILLIFATLSIQSGFSKKKEKETPKDTKTYDLALSQDDILVLPENSKHRVLDGNGVHLFVRKRGDIQSVMLLVDSGNYNDPDLSIMRAKGANSVNGNEERWANGKLAKYKMVRNPDALICTKTETTLLGECFHIYVPKSMYYGYVIMVQHEVEFEDGMRVSVRAFSEKHVDYAGKFSDNLLELNVSDWELEENFAKIAEETGGKVERVKNSEKLTEKLVEEIDSFEKKEKVEIVFAIDATESMKDDFSELKKNWLPKFEKQMKKFKNAKIGLLFYRDYGDGFNLRGLPVKNCGFLKDAKSFSQTFKQIPAKGGGDRNEAVSEALFVCYTDFEWSADAKKKVILIGDAPAKTDENPNFKKTLAQVLEDLGEKEISVDCFLISPTDEKSGGMKTVKKDDAAAEILNAVETIDAK